MHPLAQFIDEDVRGLSEVIDFSELHDKKVLITGANGIVGTYFTATLGRVAREKGIVPHLSVVVGTEPDAAYRDLLPEQAQVLVGDLTEHDFLSSLPVADYIIHAAGYGQPGRFMADPVKTLKLNTAATFVLAEKLLPGGKFLFISTSEVYSGLTEVPYREDQIGTTNTSHPRSCYIEGKRGGEAILFAHRSKGMQAKVGRLSLAYGPGTKKDDQRVLNSFIQKGLSGKISMMDAGTAHRTYCYITDAVEEMWHILLSGKEFVYNVGGESKTTIAELARKVGALLSVPVEIPEASQALSGAPDDVWMDLTKVKTEFGKKEFVSLDDGLKKTVAWQQMLYRSEE